jgi:hypothetical protein
MSEENVKEIVKEKYGHAALRVTSGDGNSCCGHDRSGLDRSGDPLTSNLYDAAQEGEVMVIHSGKTQAQVARELGCSEYSLNLWKKARVATANYPSQAVCDRLGLKKEGVLRQAEWLYDHYVDLTMNSVLRNEW